MAVSSAVSPSVPEISWGSAGADDAGSASVSEAAGPVSSGMFPAVSPVSPVSSALSVPVPPSPAVSGGAVSGAAVSVDPGDGPAGSGVCGTPPPSAAPSSVSAPLFSSVTAPGLNTAA